MIKLRRKNKLINKKHCNHCLHSKFKSFRIFETLNYIYSTYEYIIERIMLYILLKTHKKTIKKL